MARQPGRLARSSFVMSIAGAAAVVVSPLGHRVGLLTLGPAFLLFVAGFLVSLAALIIGAVMLIRRRDAHLDVRRTVTAVVVSAIAILVPMSLVGGNVGAPPIHDITTDTDDPPQFEAVLPLRADAPNSVEYGGPALAAAQRAAFPDLQSLVVSQPTSSVIEQARSIAEELGWEIVAVDPGSGRLEATATTFWFGFKDDVVVRVRPTGDGGSRVDVRSLSRVGGGDLGANANRIREFVRRLQAQG